MVAAAIVISSYQAFYDIIDVLLVKVATFRPNLVEFGQKIVEQHQFFEIQDGGSRHVEFQLQGVLRCNKCVVYKSRYILTKFGENGSKMRERHQFSKFKMAAAALLDSGYEAFSISSVCCWSTSQHLYQIWSKLVKT